MKKFKGYDAARERANFAGTSKLPIGGYVMKIQDVRYEEGTDGNSDKIVVAYDVAEGDYKDFFKKQFEENANEDKKWKGKAIIYVPRDDGSKKDEWTQNTFAKWTAAFEDSNDGYKWDWKEEKWKGLLVGIVYGETGTVIEGKEVTYTEARYPIAVQSIRDNKFKAARFKAKNGYTGTANSAGSANDFVSIPEGTEEEIPF